MALIRRIGFTRFTRFGENLGRLDVRAAKHTDALDGTDELAITCADDLAKGDRIVWLDFGGKAHEHIVDSLSRTHDSDGQRLTEATCINSINETWDDYVEDKRPSGTADVALQSVLSGTRWSVGTCDVTASTSHTFYHESVREAIGELLAAWGGELETSITVDGPSVSGRSVGIRALRGDQSSPKRFVWTKDLVSVKRSVASDNPKSRIYGYGKGVETDTGGYGRRLTFGDINGGKDYVEDTDAQALWGHPASDGTVAPSVGVFVDEDCEDAAVLLQETKDYLESVKEPKVTYEADVIDLYAFGRSWERVETGDSVAIIDRGFTDDGKGIRLKGRVTKTERDLLTGSATVTFGNLTDQLADMWESVAQGMRSTSSARATYDAAAAASPGWLTLLQGALNDQFSSAGTYKVETFELGAIYSNVPLDTNTGLPLNSTSGMWAVNINGAGIRLASSLTSSGNWDWKTFITGSQVVADCINAGILDASKVKIRNLMQVGTDSDNVSISDSAISFATNGTPNAMTISPAGYVDVEHSTFADNWTYLCHHEGSSTQAGNSASANYTWSVSDGALGIAAIHGGVSMVRFRFVFRYYLDGTYANCDSGEVYIPGAAISTGSYVNVYTNTDMGDATFTIAVKTSSSGSTTQGYSFTYQTTSHAQRTFRLLSISVRASIAKTGAKIETKDGDVVVTNSNFASLTGGYSGEFRVPYVYGNTMRNYCMKFVDGLLVDTSILTPSDDGYL